MGRGERTLVSAGTGTTARARERGAERRRGARALITAVTTGLSVTRDPRLARERFEDELRALVQARSIAIREHPPGDASLDLPANAVCLEVPLSASDATARIEAVFDPARVLDDWTCQVLDLGAHVAGLLLELERAHNRHLLAQAQRRRDGSVALIGSSHVIRALRERIDRVAATDFTVLIEGESGSGKELVARQIHERSRRHRGPFVAVNCAAIVETLLEAELFGIEERTATGVKGRRGKFEHAHDGTLFLDEVADLSAAAQAKLLRAIQDLSVERVGGCGARRVDTRIIVATNKPLASLVDRGQFRVDLFYRLNGIDVQVPPLRERRDDIIELAHHFLERHRFLRPLCLSQAAADALMAYDWPGNVRELERVMERAVALASSDRLELDDLPPALLGGYEEVLVPSLRSRHTLRDWASRYVRLVLERAQNNKRQACRELGISYHTLQSYLRVRTAAGGLPHVD